MQTNLIVTDSRLVVTWGWGMEDGGWAGWGRKWDLQLEHEKSWRAVKVFLSLLC